MDPACSRKGADGQSVAAHLLGGDCFLLCWTGGRFWKGPGSAVTRPRPCLSVLCTATRRSRRSRLPAPENDADGGVQTAGAAAFSGAAAVGARIACGARSAMLC